MKHEVDEMILINRLVCTISNQVVQLICVNLRLHSVKPLFHHCIVFASWEKNCCKEAD